MSDEVAKSTFRAIQQEKYYEFIEIYTDGSKVTPSEEAESTAAGMVIMKTEGKVYKNWRLPTSCSIMCAELFAILQALVHIQTEYRHKKL